MLRRITLVNMLLIFSAFVIIALGGVLLYLKRDINSSKAAFEDSLKEGRTDEAFRSLTSSFGIADALKEHPTTLISAVVRSVVISRNCEVVRDLAMQGCFNDSQMDAFEKLLKKVDLDQTYLKAAQTERAQGLVLFEQYRENPAVVAKWSRSLAKGTAKNSDDYTPPTNKLFKYAAGKDAEIYVREMDRFLKCAGMRYRDAEKQGLMTEFHVPEYALLTSIFLPLSKITFSRRDGYIADISATRIYLALHKYRTRYGHYPESLADVEKNLRCKLSEDPFTGKDFVYRRNVKGFILYSIGFDMKDDGGKTRDELKGKPDSEDRGDLVWKTPGV